MNDYRHDIEKYLKGELTPAERYALERKALHDPFLADALEGAEGIKAKDFSNDVDELNAKIAGQKAVPAWRLPFRIAAGVAMLAVTSLLIWKVLDTEQQPIELALEKNQPAPIPSTTDSITSGSGEVTSSQPKASPAGTPPPADDVGTRTTGSSKNESKPQQTIADLKEPAPIVAEEEKAEKIKADERIMTEPIAQADAAEKEIAGDKRAKAIADDQKLAKNDARKRAAPKDAAPTVAESRGAGIASSTPSTIIRGRVTSAEDGSPLPGVNVTIKNSVTGTATDADGNYQIVTKESNPTLVYSFIGLNSKEVKAEQQEVDVALTPDNAQLSEVVVTGYGSQKTETLPPTVEMAHPENGNRAFKQYLEKSIRYPEQAKAKAVEGRVTVEFTIQPNGSLTDFTVIRGIGSGCDEELIRLIKEGPRWIPTKKDNIPVQDKAKVRLKFELPK